MTIRDGSLDELVFHGVVRTGVQSHATLFVPGRSALQRAPNDWPEKLYPGSLNVRIDGYPSGLDKHGLPSRIVALDTGRFGPEFEILRDEFGDNKLLPRSDAPRGGDAQVWRARLQSHEVQSVNCWVLRRFGSRVGEQLEFVSDQRLRDHGFTDGQRVTVSLFGVWRDS